MAGGNLFTPDEDATILRIHEERDGKKGWASAAAKATGRDRGCVSQRIAVLKARAATEANETTFDAYGSSPLSVDDVVKKWKVDLTVWEPYHLTPNAWAIGAKHPETNKIIVRPLYQTKVRFRRKESASIEQIAKQIIGDIERAAHYKARNPKRSLHSRATPRASDVMLELDLFDLHLGKYAHAAETGDNYDVTIAERIAKAAIGDLIAQIGDKHRVTQVVMPFGQDFFQTDTPAGTTTAGTQVDHDTRFQRMFRCGHLLAMWMIEECAKIAPVHVPVVPGNHDETAAFTMGVVLEAEFRRDKRVTFDNSPKPRKYYRYGKTFLGFAHGNNEPTGQLPQLMAVERPQDWSQSIVREFHIGHIHKGKKAAPLSVDDQTGVTVRWLRSLSATDSWHAKHGFVGNQRCAEAFLWRREGGMRAHFVSLPVEQLIGEKP